MSAKTKVIVLNGICDAVHFCKNNNSTLIYSPSANSSPQEKFHKQRFINIQQEMPTAIYQPNIQIPTNEEQIVFGWNSFNEKKKWKNNLMTNNQNRLFTKLYFPVPDSFSKFKNKVENILPETYNQTLEPFDIEVKQRIKYYFYDTKLPSTYFETRNGLVKSDDSSRFSAFLSCGSLDVRFLYNEIKKYEIRNEANKSTYWLVFELLWREFFYWHYQNWQEAYFSKNGIKNAKDFTDYQVYTFSELKKMSSHPFWQASLNELEETGFQTNRTRQLFASFWIHELGLHWRAGADLFEKNLIDYDVFSNWGNWMYLAGVGVDSRDSRRFNIEWQLDRYDKNGEYLTKWT